MKLSLEVLTEGKQKGKLLPITLSQFLIGRDPECQLRPASPLISKRHCILIQREGKVFIRDFESTNGTFVNDQPLKGEIELKNQDQLKVGPIAFVVVIEMGAPVNSATPPTKPVSVPAKAPAASSSEDTKIPAKPAVPAKQAVPSKHAPAKPSVKAPVSDASSSDDDIAAMLMSLQDDSDTDASSSASDYVPEGSTVMDLRLPPGVLEGGAESEDQKTKKDADKVKEKAQQSKGNTASAAKSILEKMMRRPRP